ncbi:MAG TPA: hypothetical protein VF550_10435, partial [Polyangia bacterium]
MRELLLTGCPVNDNPLGTERRDAADDAPTITCQQGGKTYKVGETIARSACASCVCQQDGTVGMCTGACEPDARPVTATDGNTGATLNADISSINLGTFVLGKSATATVVVTNTGTAPSGSLVVTPGANLTATGCTGAL